MNDGFSHRDRLCSGACTDGPGRWSAVTVAGDPPTQPPKTRTPPDPPLPDPVSRVDSADIRRQILPS
ncbi:unnamed protein product [Arctogadus glacialis]